MPRHAARARAFTLIELLVVIAIIALLIGILLPSLKSARDSARSLVCTSNLRTLAISIHQFAEDNNGHLPRSSHSAGFNRLPWAASLYEPITGRPFLGNGYAWDDAGWWDATNTHYRCPHDRTISPIQQHGLPFALPAFSYGLNVYFELTPREIDPDNASMSSRPAWSRITSIPRPSSTVLMGGLPDGSSSDHIMAHFWRTRSTDPTEEIAHDRHGDDGSGYAWLDGHASTNALRETYDPDNNTDHWNPSYDKLFTNTNAITNP